MNSIILQFINKVRDRKQRYSSTRKEKHFIPKDHPTFGMWADDPRSVEKIMADLRKPRYGDLWNEMQIDSGDD